MFNLKGFIFYESFVDNSASSVPALGVISQDSLTYAKNKYFHRSESTPNTDVVTFHSVRDATPIKPDVPYENLVLKLGEYLYNQAIAGTITSDPNVVRQLVLAEFATELVSFSVGEMKTNGFIWLPEYIVYEQANVGERNRVQMWMSDESFRGQYDEYFIEIIHPIVPHDDFFLDPLLVEEKLRNYPWIEKTEEINVKRDKWPFTKLVPLEYDYVNPVKPDRRTPAKWYALVYGIAGDNIDIINDKIVEELLDGSAHTREEWEKILPDLFRRTEFIFTPRWLNTSIPAGLLQSDFYSPMIDPRKTLPLLRRTARGTGYTDAYVDGNYELGSNMYRSVSFGVVGNSQNRGGVISFTAQFPDYALVSNKTGDLDRLSPKTIEFMLKFEELLKVAEKMDRYTSVPIGVRRMIRDGVIYASVMLDRVNYLVVTKASVKALS